MSKKRTSAVSKASPKPSQWRPLSDVVSNILRDVRVANPPVVERPAVIQLN